MVNQARALPLMPKIKRVYEAITRDQLCQTLRTSPIAAEQLVRRRSMTFRTSGIPLILEMEMWPWKCGHGNVCHGNVVVLTTFKLHSTTVHMCQPFCSRLTALQQQFNATKECNIKQNRVMRKNTDFFPFTEHCKLPDVIMINH